MKSFSSLMGQQKLLPIIQANNVEEGVQIASAMFDAGIQLVEVVLRTSASLATITAIKAALPDLKVGAGTVLDEKTLAQALNAGADFIVTPAISQKLLKALSQCPVPVLPGVANTSDILLAREHGFFEQKLFPAALSGGCKFLTAISSVFNDIIFCPTGGINEVNFDEYLSLKNVFAAGGTWVSKPEWVADKDWGKITKACQTTLN